MKSRMPVRVAVVMGMVWLFDPGAVRGDDEVEVEYKADSDGYKVEVESDSKATPPRVIIRQRVITPPSDERTITSGTVVTRRPDYTVRQRPARSDSLWYGDSYTDDWMYSLKEYTLGDDYRAMNQAAQSPPADVFGYVDAEDVDAPRPPAVREERLRRVSGQILELRLVDVGDGGPRHVLAVIETDDGLSRRVLFGPGDRARDSGLVLGQRITAVGEPRVLNGTPVLFGSVLEPRFERRSLSPVRQGNWYHGTVLGTRVLQPIGRPERHLVAAILLDDGNTRRVDLGPVASLPVPEIQPDDRVTLLARVQNIEGEPVLVADVLRLQGETLHIVR